MKKALNTLLQTGIHESLSSLEKKQVTLLNYFCCIWYVAIPCWIIQESTLSPISYLNISIHLCTGVVVGLILYCTKQHKLQLSKTLFFSLLYIIIFFFSYINPTEPGTEYGFVLMAPFSLIFFNSRFVILGHLFFSFACFYVPHCITGIFELAFWKLEANPAIYRDPFTKFIVFLFSYLIMSYFKKQNAKSEANLVLKNRDLEESKKNQMKFFLNVAHEIRTPLTIIQGNAHKIPERNNELKSQILKQVDSLNEMVYDIINAEKLDKNLLQIKRNPVNITHLIFEVIEEITLLYQQKGVGLINNIPSNLKLYILGDEKGLKKIIKNLLSNALKFTDASKNVYIELFSNQDQCLLKVIDEGIGIENKDQPKIFTRFFQANNSYDIAGGSGIGLSLSYEMAKLHGGTLSFKSEFEKGTTFELKLPSIQLQDELPEKRKTKPIASFKENRNNSNPLKKILVVEDHLEMQEYLKNLLNEFEVIIAQNGQEALSLLEKNKDIDVVLSDYMMPIMDGKSLVAAMHKENIKTPILIVSALEDQNLINEILSNGIHDFIAKPFHPEELKVRIHNILDRELEKQKFISEEDQTPTHTLIDNKDILKIYNFIYENCGINSFSVEEVCEGLKVSKSTLYRRLKSELGFSPSGYIKEVKLQKSKNILENNPEVSIKYILNEIGWTNSTYFYDTYQKRFGVNLREKIVKI